jgi:D-inositol-3-phosphate glycosyltransferase
VKLALVGPAYPYRGGLVHFQEALYRALQARGHEPVLVTFRRQYPDWLFPGRTQYDRPRADAIAGLRWIDTLLPWTWLQAAYRIRSLGVEAVIFRYWMPFFAPAFGVMARLLRRAGIRVLAIVDNALPHERHLGDHALSRFFLRSCEAFLFLSRAVAEEVRGLGLQRPFRIIEHPRYTLFGDPVPTGEARRALGLPPDVPILLFFGYVRPYKGLGLLLEAVAAASRALPDLLLLVAGEFYEDERPYREAVDRLGLGDRVRFYPEYIPNEQVRLFFSAADLVVLPYLEATQSGVGLIAMQLERPVLATAVGGLPEFVRDGETGLLVPPRDPKAMAEAIVRFFRSPQEGERMRAAIGLLRARYSWDRLVEAIEDLLRP